jgi:hypothetical protein
LRNPQGGGLPHFRIYDLRVQAITKILSDPKVSPEVAKEIAGHSSQSMQSKYSIQLLDTKRAALEALDGASEPPPAPEVPAPLPDTQSMIQAEIAKQVAAALAGSSRTWEG